jgi:hypothetical protein
MVGKVMLTSGALKCLACWWDVVAMDKGCRPSCLRDVDVPVVKTLDRKVGPVQYRARWIDKERRLCKSLIPHLGHTSMMVIILLSVRK